MGNWAFRVSVDGMQELMGKLQQFPKEINSSLKRAGRKANTLVLQVMRTKVPKKGKKIKQRRRATVFEAGRDYVKALVKSLKSRLRSFKPRKPRARKNPKATLMESLFPPKGGKRRRKTRVAILGMAIKGVYKSAVRSAGRFLRGDRTKRKPKQYFNAVLEAGRTGMLRKSLGSKVGIHRQTGAVYAMAGPRRKTDGFITKAWSPWTKKTIDVIPSKYAHLVERGHVVVIRGKVVGRAKARPFTRPSYDEVKGKIESLTATVLQEELDKLMSRRGTAPLGGES